MPPVYIRRSMEPVLKKAVSDFPAVVLTGPRQSGKTTLLKHLFAKSAGYASLELPEVRAAAADPRGFLELHPPPVVLDEFQYAPELLPYIKKRIDAKRNRKGQYLLTCSQNPLPLEQITESLAGRAATLRLLPLAHREEAGQPDAVLPWERESSRRRISDLAFGALWEGFLRGSFPELVVDRERDIRLWYASYVQTYLDRDVRSIRQIGDLSQFQNFLRALAARSTQLLSLTDLARDLGVSLNTTKAWLSVLEASNQVLLLRPYFANVGKRLVTTPKVYFTDVGMLCYLIGIKDPDHAASGPMGGPILETAVLMEIVKTISHRGVDPEVYFWRTLAGAEVDIVVQHSGRLIPIEVKLSATPHPAMGSSIRTFQADLGAKAMAGYVVHPGDVRLPLGPDVTALPFAEL